MVSKFCDIVYQVMSLIRSPKPFLLLTWSCVLLQAYKGFEIPTEFSYLWRYLKNVYETDAFKESCPADREIITHYDGKASTKAKVSARKSQLMGEERTFSIPKELDTGNGFAG